MAPKSPFTVPKALLDAHVHHQVNMGRYATGVAHDVVGLLNQMDQELLKLIKDRVDATSFTTKRMESLLAETKQMIGDANTELLKSTADKLTDYAAHETSWGAGVLEKMTFGVLDIVQPDPEKLVALVTDKPFQGALLHEWFDKLGADKQHALSQQVRIGQSLGENTDQIVSRIRGTKAGGYKDGVLEINRRNTASVVRTATNHTSNAAQQLLLKENEDLMQGWTFVATLDSHTTVICASLSGTKWPIGAGPIPPRHFQCRSFAMPLLKTWREMGINLDEIPASTRAAVGGPVAADISFSDWLKTQTPAMQDEILGKTRAELFRKGGLTVDKFTDNLGNVLTLDQLKEKEAAAFKAAFGEGGGPTGSGGGHLGKSAPVAGPMDFSHIINPELHPDAVAAITKAEAARVAAEERAAKAKAAKAEYMKKYAAEKKAAKEAEAAAAREAEARAAEEADRKLEEAKSIFVDAIASGDTSLITDEVDALVSALSPAEKDELTARAVEARRVADLEAKKLMEAKAAHEAAIIEGKPLAEEHKAIIDALPASEKEALVAKAEALREEAKAEAADTAKKWSMYKSKIKKLMIDGEPLTPAFTRIMAKVDDAELESLKTSVEAARKAAAEKLALEKAAEKAAADKLLAEKEAERIAAEARAAEAERKLSESTTMTPELEKKWAMYKPKIKRLLLDEKPLPPAFKATLDAIPAAEREKFIASLPAPKEPGAPVPPKPAPHRPEVMPERADLDLTRYKKIGAQMGSNEGGLYEDKVTGEKWYMKFPSSKHQAKNELLANHLYRMAGVTVPETIPVVGPNGEFGIASKWVEGVTKSTAATLAKTAGVMDGFVVDAWLANWDVVGGAYDNLLILNGKAIRIDSGGSLLYRAKAGLKGSKFTSSVEEIKTLRDLINPQSYAVFKDITEEELLASAKKVLALRDEDIAAVISKFGPYETAAENRGLADMVLARKADIARRFPEAVPGWVPPRAVVKLVQSNEEMAFKWAKPLSPRGEDALAKATESIRATVAKDKEFKGFGKVTAEKDKATGSWIVKAVKDDGTTAIIKVAAYDDGSIFYRLDRMEGGPIRVPVVPQSYIDKWEASYGSKVAQFAAQNKMTVPQYIKAVEEYGKKLADAANCWIDVRAKNIPLIEKSKFMGQVEMNAVTGKKVGDGMVNPAARQSFEEKAFGVPKNAKPNEYPVYGFTSDSKIGNYNGHYGDSESVRCRWKPYVKDQTTFTTGDSLNSGIPPSPVKAPNYRTLVQYGRRDPLKEPLSMEAWGDRNSYMECQYYGHRTIADIEEMVFRGEHTFTAENEKIVNKYKIKYTVLDNYGKIVKQGNY